MISKAQALQTMQKTNNDGKRVPFSIVCLTADRVKYHHKKQLKAKLLTLVAGSSEFNELQAKIKSINAGGKLFRHGACVSTQPRGLHAAPATKPDTKPLNEVLNPHTKRPAHFKNRTRNLELVPSKNTRKVHIDLILKINNIPVLY